MSDAGERAAELTEAVFEFMEAIRPKGGILGPGLQVTPPPYEHRLGATHGPAFTVRDLLPPWEPPLPRFGTWVAPARPLPVRGRQQEIPEAFRKR